MTTEKDSSESLTKHSNLQPWQKEVLSSFMGMREGPINLVMSGRQQGKSMMLEYIQQTGTPTKKQQDQSETD